jgi:molybdopterin synthase sulfur carrier subunit
VVRVTVRAFAGLRELVGERTEVDAEHVAGLLAALTDRHGEEFTRRMTRAQVVVGEDRVPADDTSPLAAGAEVVLLPPFAGG